MHMKNSLFIEKAFLAGKFVESTTSFEVINPATQKPIGRVPNLAVADCHQAITVADEAWKTWRNVPVGERSALVRQLFELIHQHRDELAELITLEGGKPFPEAQVEVDYANSFMEWFAEEGKRSYGLTIPSLKAGMQLSTIKQGIGVVAAITPWNFPLAMITRKVAPALVAGCTIVLKPASQTPFTALALAKLVEQVGLPAGVFQVLTSKDSAAIGKELATNPLVRKLSFTGSTTVGSTLMQQAATTIKRVSMELGGNAPFIVFDDANIDKAVAGAIAGKFRNAGQTCVAVNRFYVQEAVYEQFANKLTQEVKKLIVGNGFDKGVDIGPLINKSAVDKTAGHIADAVAKGAKITCGGAAISGNFFAPTVLVDVPHHALIAKEETFGPICALFKFNTEAEVITRANDTAFGLAAYFYAENIHRCMRVSTEIEAGMVGINTGMISNAAAPFGGVKQSGVGREGSSYGLDEYMEVKYRCFGD